MENKNYRIIVDSCLDYDEDLFKSNGAFIRVPFGINIDSESIVDINLDTNILLDKMKNSKGKILSAAPSPHDYIETFDKDVVNYVITISSKLSGSYNSAIIAKDTFLEENKNSKIYVIDSLSAASGENLLAFKLKTLLDKGLSYDEVYEEILEIRDNLSTYFILEDYSVLLRNGRISNIQSFLIDLLNITPIMYGVAGEIRTHKKVRGKERAYKHIIQLINEKVINKGKSILMITYCAALDKAKKIKEELACILPNLRVMLLNAGGLSSVYANRGGLVFAI